MPSSPPNTDRYSPQGPGRRQLLYRSPLVPPVVLGLLPFILFAPLTLVRRVFAVHDVQAYFFPYHVLPAKMLADGDLPLWNPYVFSGIPLLGDGQTAMFYPPNWLFFLLPGPAALNYVLLLQFSIAGIGTYLFARALGVWRLPAFLAAVAYMFSGFLTARVVHLSIMSGAALIPLILFCLDRLLTSPLHRGPGRDFDTRWLAATALAVALQVLAGHPQIPVYTALAVGLFTVVRSVERSAGSDRWHRLVMDTRLIAGTCLLGYALAAIQLVPWAEFARLSVRAAGANFDFVFNSSTTGAEWLLFLFPYLLGAHSTSVFAAGPLGMDQAVRAWEHSGYVGILPLPLAVVALGHLARLTGRLHRLRAAGAAYEGSVLRHRWYSLLFLFLLLVLGLLLAAGWHTPFSQVVHRTPVLGSLRAVERGLVLASFALALLGGLGLQRILERPIRAWLLLPAIVIVAVPAFFAWHAQQPDVRPRFGMAPQDLANLTLELPITYIPLLLALSSGLLLVWWSFRQAGPLTQALAIALVLIDLGIYTTSFTPTANRRLYQYRPQVTSALGGDGQLFRKATVLVQPNDVVNRAAQETLAMSWGMVHGVEDINGFNSLQPRRYTDYLFGPETTDVSYGYLRNAPLLQPDSAILSSLNVRYVLVPKGEAVDVGPHLRPVFQNANVTVFENTLVYPRAYFVERVRTELDPHRVLQQVTAPGFDGRREALLETANPPSLPPPTTAGAARATRRSPNELRIATRTAEPRLLLVSEMHFPGWRAYVDGVEAPIYRANYLFRGVVVPAGHHVVTFLYRPSSVIVGTIVSALALLFVGVLLVSTEQARGVAGREIVAACIPGDRTL